MIKSGNDTFYHNISQEIFCLGPLLIVDVAQNPPGAPFEKVGVPYSTVKPHCTGIPIEGIVIQKYLIILR